MHTQQIKANNNSENKETKVERKRVTKKPNRNKQKQTHTPNKSHRRKISKYSHKKLYVYCLFVYTNDDFQMFLNNKSKLILGFDRLFHKKYRFCFVLFIWFTELIYLILFLQVRTNHLFYLKYMFLSIIVILLLPLQVKQNDFALVLCLVFNTNYDFA